MKKIATIFIVALISSFARADYLSDGYLALQQHDVDSALSNFEKAYNASPSNQEARAMYSVLKFISIFQSDEFVNLLEESGMVRVLDKNIFSPQCEMLSDSDETPRISQSWNTLSDRDYAEKILPELESILAISNGITDTNLSIKLQDSEIGFMGFRISNGTEIYMDYADIMVLKFALKSLIASINFSLNHTLESKPYLIKELSKNNDDNVSCQSVLSLLPKFLNPENSGKSAIARSTSLEASKAYIEASNAVRNRLNTLEHIFVLEDKDYSNEMKIRENVAKIIESINGNVRTFSDEGIFMGTPHELNIRLSNIFVEGYNVRSYFPKIATNVVVDGSFSDLTFGGVFVGGFPKDLLSEQTEKQPEMAFPYVTIIDNINDIGEIRHLNAYGSKILLEMIVGGNYYGNTDYYLWSENEIVPVFTKSDGTRLNSSQFISCSEDLKYVVFSSSDGSIQDTTNYIDETIKLNKDVVCNDFSETAESVYKFSTPFDTLGMPVNIYFNTDATGNISGVLNLEDGTTRGFSIYGNYSTSYNGLHVLSLDALSSPIVSIHFTSSDSYVYEPYFYTVYDKFTLSEIKIETRFDPLLCVKNTETGELKTCNTNGKTSDVIFLNSKYLCYSISGTDRVVLNLETGDTIDFMAYNYGFSPDSKYLWYHGYNSDGFDALFILDLENKTVSELNSHNYTYDPMFSPYDVMFSPDSKKLIYSYLDSNNGKTYIYDIASKRSDIFFEESKLDSYDAILSPDSKFVVLPCDNDEDGAVLYNFETGYMAKLDSYDDFVFSDDSKYALSTNRDSQSGGYLCKRYSLSSSSAPTLLNTVNCPQRVQVIGGNVDKIAFINITYPYFYYSLIYYSITEENPVANHIALPCYAQIIDSTPDGSKILLQGLDDMMLLDLETEEVEKMGLSYTRYYGFSPEIKNNEILYASYSPWEEEVSENEKLIRQSLEKAPVAYMADDVISVPVGSKKATIKIKQFATSKANMQLVVTPIIGEGETLVKDITISGETTSVEVDLPEVKTYNGEAVYKVEMRTFDYSRAVLMPYSTMVYVELESTPFRQWAIENNLAEIAPEATPHSDGITNLEKFVFGLDAHKATSYAENKLFKQTNDGNKIKFQYPVNKNIALNSRSRSANTDAIKVKTLVSEDLVNWTETTATSTTSSGEMNLYEVEMTIPESGKLFFKVEASQE